MSGAHEGCSQGKSVRDREGSKHSTAATPERVDSEAAVLPQDFEDTVHARQLKALCRRVGRRMSRQGPGRSPSMGLTHLNAARPREKSSGVPHCGSSKILSDLVSHRRATRRDLVSKPVEVCRGLSSCQAVELDTLTHRHMESRVALSSNCRVALTSCRVTVEFPVELSRPGLKSQIVIEILARSDNSHSLRHTHAGSCLMRMRNTRDRDADRETHSRTRHRTSPPGRTALRRAVDIT